MSTQATGWIGVDLDGTLARYDGWKGIEHIGPPVPAMLARVQGWLKQGIDVRIFTARVGHPEMKMIDYLMVRQAIDNWCEKHIGVRLPVTATKDMSMVQLWDDRCVQVIPNTGARADGGA